MYKPPSVDATYDIKVVKDYNISDHNPIQITINYPDNKNPTIKKNKLKTQNKQMIKEREKTIREIFIQKNFNVEEVFNSI